MTQRFTLSRWIWLGLPLLCLGVPALLRALLGHQAFETRVMTEQGPVELGTALLLIPAIAFGIGALRRGGHLPARWLFAWVAALSAGCIYFAGEELSWGQHLIGWETPEALQRVNDQQETNLHNMSSWLDQKPRLLLELWVLVGGVLVATGRLFGRRLDPERWPAWFWPAAEVAPAAWLAIAVRLPERIESWSDWERPLWLAMRLSELQELLFAVVLLLYLWTLRRRLTAPA